MVQNRWTVSDLWSAGCILGELGSGLRIFRACTNMQLQVRILSVVSLPTDAKLAEWNLSVTGELHYQQAKLAMEVYRVEHMGHDDNSVSCHACRSRAACRVSEQTRLLSISGHSEDADGGDG